MSLSKEHPDSWQLILNISSSLSPVDMLRHCQISWHVAALAQKIGKLAWMRRSGVCLAQLRSHATVVLSPGKTAPRRVSCSRRFGTTGNCKSAYRTSIHTPTQSQASKPNLAWLHYSDLKFCLPSMSRQSVKFPVKLGAHVRTLELRQTNLVPLTK